MQDNSDTLERPGRDLGNVTCMAFRIALERPDHGNYTAGETVRGKLILSSNSDESVGSIKIQLLGHKILRFGRGEAMRKIETPIIEETKVLYDSNSRFPAHSTYTWSFDITFPEFYRPNAELAEYDTPEPLPPSLYDDDARTSLNHVCMVHYFLAATLTRPPSTRSFKGYECKAPLTYVMPPSRIPSFVDAHKRRLTNSFDVATSLAVAAPERRASSGSNLGRTKKNWYKLTRNDGLQVPYSFEVCITTYDHLCIGQTMPVRISVRQLPSSDENTYNPPPVSLKMIWPSIRAITSVSLGDDLGNEGLRCVVRHSYQKSPGQGFNEFEFECNYIKEFFLDIEWHTGIVPTFRLANLSRVYLLKLEMLARCANKSIKMEVQHTLTMLPEPPSAGRPVPAEQVDEHDAPPLYSMDQIPSDPLPDYQENAAAGPSPAVVLPPAVDYPPPLDTPPAAAYQQPFQWNEGVTVGGAGNLLD